MEIIDNINRFSATTSRARSLAARGSASPPRRSRSTPSRRSQELKGVKELEFIFTLRRHSWRDQATDKCREERREFFIPQAKRDRALYGSEFEIRLRNKLTQTRNRPRVRREWIKRKGHIQVEQHRRPMQQFAVVDETAAYMPLQGFTSADLGYERGNAVSNMVNKVDDAPARDDIPPDLQRIWTSPQQVEDVTEAVYEHIASVYAENSPERVYFLILYNLFASFSTTSARTSSPTTSPATKTPRSGSALQLPAGRRYRNHQQAGDLQRVHPRRQRGPWEDVHGAGCHQVLRVPQQVRPGPRPQETRPTTGRPTTVPYVTNMFPTRPVQLPRARPHRPAA